MRSETHCLRSNAKKTISHRFMTISTIYAQTDEIFLSLNRNQRERSASIEASLSASLNAPTTHHHHPPLCQDARTRGVGTSAAWAAHPASAGSAGAGPWDRGRGSRTGARGSGGSQGSAPPPTRHSSGPPGSARAYLRRPCVSLPLVSHLAKTSRRSTAPPGPGPGAARAGAPRSRRPGRGRGPAAAPCAPRRPAPPAPRGARCRRSSTCAAGHYSSFLCLHVIRLQYSCGHYASLLGLHAYKDATSPRCFPTAGWCC